MAVANIPCLASSLGREADKFIEQTKAPKRNSQGKGIQLCIPTATVLTPYSSVLGQAL